MTRLQLSDCPESPIVQLTDIRTRTIRHGSYGNIFWVMLAPRKNFRSRSYFVQRICTANRISRLKTFFEVSNIAGCNFAEMKITNWLWKIVFCVLNIWVSLMHFFSDMLSKALFNTTWHECNSAVLNCCLSAGPSLLQHSVHCSVLTRGWSDKKYSGFRVA